jgi:hypothetical protein
MKGEKIRAEGEGMRAKRQNNFLNFRPYPLALRPPLAVYISADHPDLTTEGFIRSNFLFDIFISMKNG